MVNVLVNYKIKKTVQITKTLLTTLSIKYILYSKVKAI